MKNLLKNKFFIASTACVLALAVLVTAVYCCTKKRTVSLLTSESSQSEPGNIYTETGQSTSNIAVETGNTQPIGETSAPPVLEVNGNPVKTSAGSTSPKNQSNNADSDNKNQTETTSTQKPPSVDIKVEKDSEQPKETESYSTLPNDPNYPSNPDDWVPPPPGEGGGELISSGLENIPVSADKSVETLQLEIGLDVGDRLIQAGYKTLYPDAGTPEAMVKEAVQRYAETGAVTLNPEKYGLLAIVGYYNVKLPVHGANAAESAEYIYNHIKNDAGFNEKVKTVFNKYLDGFLSVYQKDGCFYVLFAVIDKDYCNAR